MTEPHRERLTSHLAIRGIPLQNYTFDLIRTTCLELFCAPRSSLENPSFRPSNQQKTFLVQDYGELDGSTGYWAADRDTGQERFVQEFEDIFWVHDEVVGAWIARRFKGGRILTKGPRKGRRKGTNGGKDHILVSFMRYSTKLKENQRKSQGTKRKRKRAIPCGLDQRKRKAKDQVQD